MQRVRDTCTDKNTRLQELSLLCINREHNTPLTFQTPRSVKLLSSLNVLLIQYGSPISLSLAELTSVISSLPQPSKLCLNESPLYCETATIGLDLFPMIAQSCKELSELTLFLDAGMPLSDARSYLPSGSFSKLGSLSVGVSVVTKEVCQSAALCLSTHLPLGYKLQYGARWITTTEDIPDSQYTLFCRLRLLCINWLLTSTHILFLFHVFSSYPPYNALTLILVWYLKDLHHEERVRIAKERIKLWEEAEVLVRFPHKVLMQERSRVSAA